MAQKRELISNYDLGIPYTSYVNRKMVDGLKRFSGISGLNTIYWAYDDMDGESFVRAVLERQGVKSDISELSLGNIPTEGGFIAVANRPYGILDTLLIMDLILRKRKDIKFIGNFIVSQVEPLADYFIEVDPFTPTSSVNLSGIRHAMDHVRGGGVLVVFPSSDVATHQTLMGDVHDSPWLESTMKFVKMCKVPILPVYISGGNSTRFHWLGKVHPMLRMAQLPREFLRKTNVEIAIKVGKPFAVADQVRIPKLDTFSNFIRSNVYLLRERSERRGAEGLLNSPRPTSQTISKADFDALSLKLEAHKMIEVGTLILYHVNAKELSRKELKASPQIEEQIKKHEKLRESRFERIHDLTLDRLPEIKLLGKAKAQSKANGLDSAPPFRPEEFSSFLVILDHSQDALVLSSELVMGRDLFDNGGGLEDFRSYGNFEFSRKMIDTMKRSVELTALYSNAEYSQRSDALKLLWGGILRITKQHPWCENLIGVSRVSEHYSLTARMLIIGYLKFNAWNRELSKMVIPRHGSIKAVINDNVEEVVELVETSINGALIDKLLGDLVEQQGELSRMPLMLKRYLAMGGNVVSLNVDVDNGNALDMLLLLKLER